MSIEVARYQFHSWARRGIAGNISEADHLGAGASPTLERAEVPVGVSVNGAALTRRFSLLGPGDIIGVNRDMIVRTEPRNWITDFESNYLAFIEFYDEDFAWRYTPAAPSGSRLRPWLFLLVLAETEFERTKRRVPLPTITVKDASVFPPAAETWLWAHVHSNADIPDGELSNYERFLQSLNKTVTDDPDQVYCRLMSPRKLQPHTQYSAFLIPAFETGRLAGLEQPTEAVEAQRASWDAAGAAGEMPFYHEWFFRTGASADFESLVRLLEPKPMDPSVGIRDMDCHRPGFVTADGAGELPATSPPLIGLEGAVKSPQTQSTVFPNPPDAVEFQEALQEVVNLPFQIVSAAASGDPVISMPLYGGKHAKRSATDVVTLDVTRDRWVDRLNKDPRWRVGAGFGTTVVQRGQEDYMRKAWEQAAAILEANARIRRTRFYMDVAVQYTEKTLSRLPQASLMAISKPVFSRVMGSPATILQQIRESPLPLAVYSGAFRRMIRPRGKLTRRLGGARALDYGGMVARIMDGTLTGAPAREVPKGLPNTRDLGAALFPPSLPAWIVWLLRLRVPVLLLLFLLLWLLLGLLTGLWIVAAVALLVVAAIVMRLRRNLAASQSLTNPGTLAESIPDVPPRPGFTLSLSDEAVQPPATPTTPGADSVEAARFRTAVANFSARVGMAVTPTVETTLNLGTAYDKVAAAIHPHQAFPLRLTYFVGLPGNITLRTPEQIFEAMAYPDFDEPMYKKLVDISGELLLPNLHAVPENTISLLKTNQAFIESYLVGLNHEMGRELLWREYPTDERGSYFRQFWDVKGLIRPQGDKTPSELTEASKDIEPIHRWETTTRLGTHSQRTAGGADQTVLIIRGDLLKRYPNTVIFAQKAVPGTSADEPLIDTDLTDDEFARHVKFPLYKADLPPDIKLFGFDLTIKQSRGIDSSPGFTDDLGWFFVIQEVPGEPRFGMDIQFEQGSDGLSWDDLAWDRLPADTKFIKANVIPNLNVPDRNKWGTDSANMAFVLFQKPSMIAIHAKEMLEKLTE